MTYRDILLECKDGIVTVTINRPDDGNRFTRDTALELADALRRFRSEPDWRVAVLTGAGDRFFCIGGEHDPVSLHDYAHTMPIVDVYELLDSVPKPVVAAVNGFAVGGGNVLHTICDLTIAAEHAVFRQVGPLVGSFDAGYGTWHLEDVIGRKRAKELWYLNRKYSAAEALAMGLVNEVVPGTDLMPRAMEIADELKHRGAGPLAAIKGAFSARHSGVVGQSRMLHDQMLTYYLRSEEAGELSDAFSERRQADPEKFLR